MAALCQVWAVLVSEHGGGGLPSSPLLEPGHDHVLDTNYGFSFYWLVQTQRIRCSAANRRYLHPIDRYNGYFVLLLIHQYVPWAWVLFNGIYFTEIFHTNVCVYFNTTMRGCCVCGNKYFCVCVNTFVCWWNCLRWSVSNCEQLCHKISRPLHLQRVSISILELQTDVKRRFQ